MEQGRVYPLSILWSTISEPTIFSLSRASRVLVAFHYCRFGCPVYSLASVLPQLGA